MKLAIESLELVNFRKKHLVIKFIEKVVTICKPELDDDTIYFFLGYLEEKGQLLEAAKHLAFRLYSLRGNGILSICVAKGSSIRRLEEVKQIITFSENREATPKVSYPGITKKLEDFKENADGENLHVLKKMVELTRNDNKEAIEYIENKANILLDMIMFVFKKHMKRDECFDIRTDSLHVNFTNIKQYLEFIQKICGSETWVSSLGQEKVGLLMLELIKQLLTCNSDKAILAKEAEMGSKALKVEIEVLSKLVNSGVLRLLGHD